MTDQTPTVEEIAEGLSEAHITALLWLPGDGSWTPGRAYWKVAGQLVWLSRAADPLVETMVVGRNGNANDRRWRLSVLGLQVRAHLRATLIPKEPE